MSRTEYHVEVVCDCGRHEVPLAAVQVTICDERLDLARYIFTCPGCSAIRIRKACGATLAMLLTAGLEPIRWTMPAEEVHDGPPIGLDDVLDFCLGLGGDFASELTQ